MIDRDIPYFPLYSPTAVFSTDEALRPEEAPEVVDGVHTGGDEDGELRQREEHYAFVGGLAAVAEGRLALLLVGLLVPDVEDAVVHLAHKHLELAQVLGLGELLVVDGVGAGAECKRELVSASVISVSYCVYVLRSQHERLGRVEACVRRYKW